MLRTVVVERPSRDADDGDPCDDASVYTRFALRVLGGVGADCDPAQLTTWAGLRRWRAHRRLWADLAAAGHPDPVLVCEWDRDPRAPAPAAARRRAAAAPRDAAAVVVVLRPPPAAAGRPGALAYVLRDAATAARLAAAGAAAPASAPVDVWLTALWPRLDDAAVVATVDDDAWAPAAGRGAGAGGPAAWLAAGRDALAGGYVRWVPDGTVRDAVRAGLLVAAVTLAVVAVGCWLGREAAAAPAPAPAGGGPESSA